MRWFVWLLYRFSNWLLWNRRKGWNWNNRLHAWADRVLWPETYHDHLD